MHEDFLHYVWKLKKFDVSKLKTNNNEVIEIVSVGQHNLNSGPDFFNAHLRIKDQLWAGNVEIHVRSSDWFIHNHEVDPSYDNVILHVVWENDTNVFRKNNTPIPTLELKDHISKEVIKKYQQLFSKEDKWIKCDYEFNNVSEFIINNWLERLFFERLERKSKEIEELLVKSANDWEAICFKLIVKNFGSKVNGDSFFSLANSIPFSIVRKQQANLTSLEALLFGQANLLENDVQEPYLFKLKNEYEFLRQKFNLNNSEVLPLKFFRLRPSNFPTIRLSQLANLYHQNQNLFSRIIEEATVANYYKLFGVGTSQYWKTHYTFDKSSKSSSKKISKAFIDLLLINAILPLKLCYAKRTGARYEEEILNLIQSISSEENSIIKKFNGLKPISKSALQSQALIQLKNEYCDKNKCLQCAIGNDILTRNC